jgi:hypothetical protein
MNLNTNAELRALINVARNGPEGLDTNDPEYERKLDNARIDARCYLEGNALSIIEMLLDGADARAAMNGC